jgi:hypothetical protein
MESVRKAYKNFGKKTLGKRPLGRICGRRKVAFKCILKKEDVECVHLDQ